MAGTAKEATLAPGLTTDKNGSVRLHAESSIRKSLPGFLADFVELTISLFVIHYFWWFWGVCCILYYVHWCGYTVVSVGLIVAYLPVYMNGAHKKVTVAEGNQKWDWLRTHPIWTCMCEYMKLDIVREAELDPKKQYVFGFHPHGILILSRLTAYAGNFEKLFPGIEVRALGATPMFYVPLARELCLWLTVVDASSKTAARVLDNDMSIIVYPGGSKEIFLTDPKSKDTQLVLSDRMGFVKLAIKYGAELVPVFVFGEKWMYNIWNPPASVRKFFYKTLKVPFLAFWGRFGTWLPVQLTGKRRFGVVYGKPIPVTKNENPTDEEIAALHAIYVERVKEIFAKYKTEFGYDDDETLTIIASKTPRAAKKDD
ncbi:Aste57867_9153 [Aphanomyces stellatus]|uniref:Acyltransferase n=1 Tax=Aphanomyces stellatus TaxID=120398 RepID=A0A485KM34_9STRA|nr:hypothetical protein As57867_009117 [Aphanomyces stellatus]VFT86037.1 Aste57867_9153 [Aphanomyces stellatus]